MQIGPARIGDGDVGLRCRELIEGTRDIVDEHLFVHDVAADDPVEAWEIGGWVEEVNRDLAQVETIKRFALLEKELDHEDGELTATLKVKRRALEQRFERQIGELYV